MGHPDPSYAPLLVQSDLTLTLTLTPFPLNPIPVITLADMERIRDLLDPFKTKTNLQVSENNTHPTHAPCHVFRLLDHTYP